MAPPQVYDLHASDIFLAIGIAAIGTAPTFIDFQLALVQVHVSSCPQPVSNSILQGASASRPESLSEGHSLLSDAKR